MSSVALRHQAAVAGRIGGLESQHRDRRAVRQSRRAASPGSAAGSAAYRRRSPRCRRRPFRWRPWPPEPHARCRGVRVCTNTCASAKFARASAETSSCSGPTTTAIAVFSGRLQRAQHMTEQRTARHHMQHLRPRRAHPRAFAGREHDRQAGSPAHLDSLQVAAVIAGCTGRGTFETNLLTFSTR